MRNIIIPWEQNAIFLQKGCCLIATGAEMIGGIEYCAYAEHHFAFVDVG